MYTQEYYSQIGKSYTKNLILGFAMWAVIVAICVVGMIMRNIWLAIAAPTVLAPVAYTVWCLKILPWLRYNRHMDNLKTGRRRETECYILDIADATRMVDGVEIHDVTASLDAEGTETRLYYWDNDMPMPEIDPSKKLTVESYGNFITGLEGAGN